MKLHNRFAIMLTATLLLSATSYTFTYKLGVHNGRNSVMKEMAQEPGLPKVGRFLVNNSLPERDNLSPYKRPTAEQLRTGKYVH